MEGGKDREREREIEGKWENAGTPPFLVSFAYDGAFGRGLESNSPVQATHSPAEKWPTDVPLCSFYLIYSFSFSFFPLLTLSLSFSPSLSFIHSFCLSTPIPS